MEIAARRVGPHGPTEAFNGVLNHVAEASLGFQVRARHPTLLQSTTASDPPEAQSAGPFTRCILEVVVGISSVIGDGAARALQSAAEMLQASFHENSPRKYRRSDRWPRRRSSNPCEQSSRLESHLCEEPYSGNLPDTRCPYPAPESPLNERTCGFATSQVMASTSGSSSHSPALQWTSQTSSLLVTSSFLWRA